MLRRVRASLVLGVLVVSACAATAAAQDEPLDDTADVPSASADAQPAASADKGTLDAAPAEASAALSVSGTVTASEAEAPKPSSAEKPEGVLDGWHTEIHGYFRAPMAIGVSSRPNPDMPMGPSKTQVSYAPNRTMDWSYYSFAYTRLQEQDWAELTFHAKKKHVDAAVGWMGYWLSATGFRNPDAAMVPGIAYLTLDTDLELGSITPNLALKMGAFWPQFGYFAKYDTLTLGRFRQVGEQLQFTVPLNADFTVTAVQGFGTGRDGAFSYNVANNSPLYASKVGADLLAYFNLALTYKKYVDVSLHYNTEWTNDPYLTADASPTSGKAYTDAARAHLSVVGAEASVQAPYAGKLWISPSFVSVRNGWALGAGTEVMHSLGGVGIATNYLAWTNSPSDSTGTGSMFNLGFLYENSLARVKGKEPGSLLPDVTLNIFGLLANASLELPAGTTIKQKTIDQLKYGADVTVQALSWLGVLLRYDSVTYDTHHPGYIFSAITGRVFFSSHFLSGERIYLQYSKYRYGDHMVLAGQWPWGNPLVAGTDVVQGGSYFGKKPDEDVFKVQAEVTF